jgi:hypothetical protein
VAVTVRDEFIGWTPEVVVAEMRDRPTAKLADWLHEIVNGAIEDVFKVDLYEDGLISPKAIRRPMPEVIEALEVEGRGRRVQHRRYMQSKEYKKAEAAERLPEEHWESQARSHLFRSKRCLELAQLLRLRAILQTHFGSSRSKKALEQFASDRAGHDAVAMVVRKAKADRVGTAIADLTVCGALPPYNEILGGKLVAMLMVGPETLAEYRRRYSGTPSIIASSMAGRPVIRPAELVFIGTTSLYGQRPSQYDRISFRPESTADAKSVLRYEFLGRTKGIGTFHFGARTVAEITSLLTQSQQGQRVNSVFGEGVNPRLRKIRDGFDMLGLPTDELLNHGAPRLVYGIRLATNCRDYLLGLAKKPKYILPPKATPEVSDEIVTWWVKRWLLPRLKKDEVLDRVAQHNLVHPIRHGARVELPVSGLDLFSEIAG